MLKVLLNPLDDIISRHDAHSSWSFCRIQVQHRRNQLTHINREVGRNWRVFTSQYILVECLHVIGLEWRL